MRKNSGQSSGPFGPHGARMLPRVEVLSYNIELREKGKFLGDLASKASFRKQLDKWRAPLLRARQDPFGGKAVEKIGRKELDAVLKAHDPAAASAVMGAIEDFSHDLAMVVRRFLRQKSWEKVRRITVGGGMSGRWIGRLVIAHALQILAADGFKVEMSPIANDPDDAGLIGSLYQLPEWVFKGYGAILAVDIGGSNIRTGIVQFRHDPRRGFSRVQVRERRKWKRWAERTSRDTAVATLARMLQTAMGHARKKRLALAPVIGIACPGIILPDGGLSRGTQNLPGNWSARDFKLNLALLEKLPRLDGQEFQIVIHNDAVVQGLSEIPRMQDVTHWGVLTLGTGLGNACFRAR